MTIFRSETMTLCYLVMHPENAFDCLVELGYLGKVQFINRNEPNQIANMRFSSEIQRCFEMARTMKRLQDEIHKAGMATVYYPDADDEKPLQSDLGEMESTVSKIDSELLEVLSRCEALQNRRLALFEHKQILRKVEEFFESKGDPRILSFESFGVDLITDGTSIEEGDRSREQSVSLSMIVGSIPIDKFAAFEKVIWRISHGTAFVRNAQFELPMEIADFEHRRYKYAFLIMIIGDALRLSIQKVCQGFQARLYPCEGTTKLRAKQSTEISRDLDYLSEIFQRTCEHKKRVLAVASADLFIWRAKLNKIQSVYTLLNNLEMMREHRERYLKYLQTQCWIPTEDIKDVRSVLFVAAQRSTQGQYSILFPPMLIERRTVPPNYKQPTYFKVNKFTNGFQNLINSYGIASYRELNPAPFTIVTFPFLFAVMFGDVGHGLIMTLFAITLVWREEKIKRQQLESITSSEIMDILFAGRYILLFMGFFSIYTGLIYNDILSKPINLFGSSWHTVGLENEFGINGTKIIQLDPADKRYFSGTPYIFGLDPVWNAVSTNAIILNNSIKMKMAIILGVFQMLFGLCISACNDCFFKSKIDLYLVFLPQFVFLSSLFFYLVVLVFYKWVTYGGLKTGSYSSKCAPSILITFINMVLLKKGDNPPEGCNEFMYAGQNVVQLCLLAMALLSIPVMLCGKPIHFHYQHKRIKSIKDPHYKDEIRRSTFSSLRKSLIYSVEFAESFYVTPTNEENKIAEVWIHQGIHTIECVLGSISHTASYLRLWALSLAHSQLSEVLWQMVLSSGLKSSRGFLNSIVMFATFSFFASLTVAILVLMEGLSAFLHTLRLHWVEFQSKFYDGLGEMFIPFCFKESRKSDSYS